MFVRLPSSSVLQEGVCCTPASYLTCTRSHMFEGALALLLLKKRAAKRRRVDSPCRAFLLVYLFPRLTSTPPYPMPLPTHSRTPPQLEVTDACPQDVDVKAVDADGTSIAAEDKGGDDGSRSRPSRPGDSASAAARNRGTAAGGAVVTGSAAAGVKEGAATDQEESGGGGGQRERARPTSAQSAKSSSSSKVEEELSVLRIGGAGTGADGVSSAGDGPPGGLLLESVEQRVRQDSSRSPLPHENAAGGEDDASVLDTPLQDKVREREGPLPKALTRLWFLCVTNLCRCYCCCGSFCPRGGGFT